MRYWECLALCKELVVMHGGENNYMNQNDIFSLIHYINLGSKISFKFELKRARLRQSLTPVKLEGSN